MIREMLLMLPPNSTGSVASAILPVDVPPLIVPAVAAYLLLAALLAPPLLTWMRSHHELASAMLRRAVRRVHGKLASRPGNVAARRVHGWS